MSELLEYLDMLASKMRYAEELYGIPINCVPIIIDKEIIVYDRRDGSIKRLSDKKRISKKELKKLEKEIIKNIESGKVDLYLTLTFGEDVGLGEG
ncbi:hypothetical protein [Thermococcus barophilus]|uniref:Uncharacterized protein n=1 Tax=Thermococcus barophilus (strain DSM 11836 / MP) TaxID=391623 RepID=F0LM17_THEBM|nr:hypothetical protein [Thermococcus barophilus]ADT85116.1 hypothetical protein TERMP_02142 [Thermococcus barophilus MP]